VGILYVVPTPIGNLEDITLRALRILGEVALIAAEDTRTSRVLLKHYTIETPLTSYHEHNKLTKLDQIFATLDQADVALISDAGMPGISDPGYELISAAIAQGYPVQVLPGANAALTALVGSGLPTDAFVYVGFLPRKAKARTDFLHNIAEETRTLIAYESPNRLLESLEAIHDTLGPERSVCVAREVSKLYEEFVRGTSQEVLAHFRVNAPRGEIVLLIGGATPQDDEWDAARIQAALQQRLDAGESLSTAAKNLAQQSGWNRRDVYALGLNPDDDA
jgi:16S rRNA (cytidine1402-2'-O)-methyltransferase